MTLLVWLVVGVVILSAVLLAIDKDFPWQWFANPYPPPEQDRSSLDAAVGITEQRSREVHEQMGRIVAWPQSAQKEQSHFSRVVSVPSDSPLGSTAASNEVKRGN